jgi:hypothetical protein
MNRNWIDTTEPLTDEDPSLVWLRREHPERYTARSTPHAFVHSESTRDPRDTCPPEGNAGCICDTCWERKSFRIHKAARP